MHMKNTKKKTLTGLLICIFLIAALFLGRKTVVLSCFLMRKISGIFRRYCSEDKKYTDASGTCTGRL